MTYELSPQTAAGRKFYDAANDLVPQLRQRAAQSDRQAQVCEQSFRNLAERGITAAFVPESLGGWGLHSVHDWLVGIAALARGDGSTAIAINMHLGVTRGMVQGYQADVAAGRENLRLRQQLEAIVQGRTLICATATERGTDNLHPLTEATQQDGAWRIDGSKLFVTMSPVASHLGMNLRMRDGEGDHLVTTLLPIDAPGIQPQGDWDSLGMRGSGSQSIKFDNVRVAKTALRRIGPWGKWSTNLLISRTLGNLPLVAAFLGIAEHARELALSAVKAQKRLGDSARDNAGVQQLVGEMEIELAACRSILQRAGEGIDALFDRLHGKPPSLEQAHELMKDYQSAKWVVNKGAIEIVGKAMDLVGGGAFMSSHPLSMLYRDVRAGPFMQPFSPTEARGYVGQVALGRPPL